MTKRTLALASLHALGVTAILALGEQAAYGSDTIWDLLRKGDPAHKRVTPVVPLGKAAGLDAASKPSEVIIDPKTGRQVLVPLDSLPKPKPGGVLGFFDSVGSTFSRLGRQLNSDIKISGDKSIGYHAESITGNSDSYTNDRDYYGRRGVGGTYQDTDLLIQGKVAGILNFETRYTDRLYGNPYDNRVSLNYETKHFKFDAGDIQAGITGNSLLEFSRSLKGIQLSADVLKGVRLTSLFSQTKAQTRTLVLQGANSSGPYYVYAGQVVDGSEKVRVNNQDMIKGTDYTLDPYTGRLDFLKGRIIGVGETIAVTFEAYGYEAQAGTLTGFRADMDFLKNAKFGVSFLSQTSPSNGSSTPEKTEQFPGYQNETTPYVLLFPVQVSISKDSSGNSIATPLKPMKVTVDGVPKIYGTDYVVNPFLPNQVFIRGSYVPDTKIFITYTPDSNTQAGGNRRVMGADARFSLGKVGNITAELANSTLDLNGRSIGGTAMQLLGDMRFFKDKLAWNWTLRNIGDNFTAIESPGFRRNERGMTMGFNYTPTKNLKFNANFEKSKRPSYDYNSLSSGGSTALAQANGSDDYSSIVLGANWQLGKAGTLTFNHNSMSTLSFNGGKSIFGSDTLNFNYTGIKSFDFGFMFGRNSNVSAFNSGTTGGTTGSTNSLTSYNTDSVTSRINMTWTANSFLKFNTILANNLINNGTGRKSNAQDISFTTDIQPLRSMRLTLGYQLQNSGGYNGLTTGTNTGTTTGTNTGSTTGSNNGTTSGTSGGGTDVRRAATSRQTPIGSGLGGSFGNYGGTYGNTFGSSYGGGYNSNLGNFGNYSGGFVSNYVGSYSGGSFGGNSRNLTANWTYQPWQPLNFSLTWASSTSEGDYLFNSRRNDLQFTVTYALGERMNISTMFGSQKVAYIGQTGGTNTSTMNINLSGRPIGRLQTSFNYMRMRTAGDTTGTNGTGLGNNLGNGVGSIGDPYGTGSSYTGGYTPFFGGFNSNIDSFSTDLQYPIFRGNNLFVRFDTSSTGGYGASDSKTLSFGMIFNLGNRTNFTLGWRTQQHVSKDPTSTANYNYNVSSLDAVLGVHF